MAKSKLSKSRTWVTIDPNAEDVEHETEVIFRSLSDEDIMWLARGRVRAMVSDRMRYMTKVIERENTRREETRKELISHSTEMEKWRFRFVTGEVTWEGIPSRYREMIVQYHHHSDGIPQDTPEWIAWSKSWQGQNSLRNRHRYQQRKQEELEAIKRQVVMEWTHELLNASLALPDGRVITWGSATISDHEARINMLHANVMANADAIARHEYAIQYLIDHGSERLQDAKA